MHSDAGSRGGGRAGRAVARLWRGCGVLLTKYGVLYKKSAITHGAITPQKVAPIREHSPDDWRL